jgi:hypothetical protein
MWKRFGWTVLAICIAYPAVLAVVPSTRWAVVSRTRVALAEEDYGLGYDRYRDSMPVIDRDSELAALAGVGTRRVTIDERYAAARRNWNDRLYVALFVAETSDEADIPSKLALPYPPSDPARWALAREREVRRLRPVWKRLIEVCDQGSLIEPSNAFYPAMAAAAASALDRKEDAFGYLSVAGTRTQFDSHSMELESVYQRAAIRAFGYRGCEVLPAGEHEAWAEYLSFLAREVRRLPLDRAGLRARLDVLHVAHLIYRSASSDRELASVAAVVRILSGVVVAPDTGPGRAREEYLEGIARLAQTLDPSTPRPLEARMRQMIAAGDHVNIERMRDYPTAPAWEAVMGYTFMDSMGEYASMSSITFAAALVALGVLAVCARFPIRFHRPSLLPFVAAAALSQGGIFTDRIGPDGSWYAVGFSAFYLAAGLVAMRKEALRYAIITSAIAPLVALIVLLNGTSPGSRTDIVGYLAVPVCAFPLFIGLYAWRERRGTSTEFFLAPQLGAIALGIGLISTTVEPASWPVLLTTFAVTLAIVLTAVTAFQGVPVGDAAGQMRRYAYWPTAVAGLWCGLALTGYLWHDASQLRMWRKQEASAVEARQWVRDHPDGLLHELRALEQSRDAK